MALQLATVVCATASSWMVTEYCGSSLTADKILCPEACFLLSSCSNGKYEKTTVLEIYQINSDGILPT